MTAPLDRLKSALADRYTIERELGAGGMATVYLAEDLKHHRKVAIKVMHPELAAALGPERFLREIETSARLTHPHILPLLDSGGAGGLLFYVMPYVEGESLRDRLTRERQLPLDAALQIAREVADGLSYAHAHGVIHRDIKPENILLESGHAVVTDFGIARAIDAAGGERLTQSGLALGTPQYMSPEQAAGNQDLDGRSDLYALGCMLYEMLAGQPPFTGPTADSVVRQHLAAEPPSISVVRPAVPAAVAAALQRALAKTPADRFTTAAQFAEALTASSSPRPARAARPGTRARVAALLGGLLVIAAAVAVLHETGILWPSGGLGGGGRLTSLAVLPLVNLSGDTAQEYFADGMTEALITELGKVSALTVCSRTSVMTFKRSTKPLREIARELGVQGVVEASVLREGGQVRISARLIDGRTDRRLWDSTYDREAASVLALQAEVARTVAGAIGATLTSQETRRLDVRRRVNPQAYDEYLLGQQDAVLLTAQGFERAIAHYRRAIALDSTFADPYSAMAEVYIEGMSAGSISPRNGGPLARRAAESALALDSGSARAHAALAVVRSTLEFRWQDADAEFRRALELNPGLWEVHTWYSTILTALGRHSDAVSHGERAATLDPLRPDLMAQLGLTYFYAGRFREALAELGRTLDLSQSLSVANQPLAWTYSALGRHREAIEAIGRALKGDPENQAVRGSAVVVYARAGKTGVARLLLDSLLATGTREWVDPYNVGWAYAWLGETGRAMKYFNRAIDERSVNVGFLRTEWLPLAFKADSRYAPLLGRVGLERSSAAPRPTGSTARGGR